MQDQKSKKLKNAIDRMAIIENKKLNFIYLPMIGFVGIIFIDIKKQYNRRYTPQNCCRWEWLLSTEKIVIDWKQTNQLKLLLQEC